MNKEIQKTISIPIHPKTTRRKINILDNLTARLTYGVREYLKILKEKEITTRKEAEKYRKVMEKTGLNSNFTQQCRDKALEIYKGYKEKKVEGIPLLILKENNQLD